jgi:hypothetical protein
VGKPLLIMGLELGETRWVLLDVLAAERPAVYQQDSGRLEHAGETKRLPRKATGIHSAN